METRKWVRNVGFVTCAMLGTRELDRGSVVREMGQARGGEKLEKKREKESKHGQGSSRANGEAVKNKNAKCPQNCQRSRCKECGESGICEHNRTRKSCKQCGGSSICEYNRERSWRKR